MDNAPESIMNGVEGNDKRSTEGDHKKCKENGMIENSSLKKQSLSNTNGTMKPPSDLCSGDGPEVQTSKPNEVENSKLDAVKKCFNGQPKHFQDMISGGKEISEVEKENSELSNECSITDKKDTNREHVQSEKDGENLIVEKSEVVVNGTTQIGKVEIDATEDSSAVVEEKNIENGKDLEVKDSMEESNVKIIDMKNNEDKSENVSDCEEDSSAMKMSGNDIKISEENVMEKKCNDDSENTSSDPVLKGEGKSHASLIKSKFSLKGNLDSVKGLVKAAVTKVSQESSNVTVKSDSKQSEGSTTHTLSKSQTSSRTSSPQPTGQDSPNDSAMTDKDSELKEKETEDAILKDDHEGEDDSMEVDDSILDQDCHISEPSPSNSIEPQKSIPSSENSQEKDANIMDTNSDISENICDTENTEKDSPISNDVKDGALSCNGVSQIADETVKQDSDKDNIVKKEKDTESSDSADASIKSEKEILNGAKTEVSGNDTKKEIKEDIKGEICENSQKENDIKDGLNSEKEIEKFDESLQDDSSKDSESTSRKRPLEEEGNSVLQNKKSRLDNVLDKIGKKSRLDDVIGKLGSKIGIKPEDVETETPTDLEEKEEEEEEEEETLSVISEGSDKSKDSEDSERVLQLTVKELNEYIVKRMNNFLKNNKKTLIGQLQAKIKKLEEKNKEWQVKTTELKKRINDAIYMQNHNGNGKKKVTTRNMSIQVNSQKVEAMMLQGKNNPSQRPQTATATQASTSQGMIHKQFIKSPPTQSTTVRQMLNAKKNMTPANSLVAKKAMRKARAGGGVIDLTDDDELPKATTITLAPGQVVRTSMPASANIQKLTTVPQTIGQTLLRPGTILVQAPNPTPNTMVLQQMKGNTPTYLYASGTQPQSVVLQQGNQIRGTTSQLPVTGARPMQTQLIAVRNPVPGNTVSQVMTRAPPPLQTVPQVVSKPLNPGIPPPLKPAPSPVTHQPDIVTTERAQAKTLPSVATAKPMVPQSSTLQASRDKLMDDLLKRASELASQKTKKGTQSQDKDVEFVSICPPTHPAPLPAQPKNSNKQHPKLEPPKPSLKISRIQQGIVLSWNMKIDSSHADIKSYQLFAYQEGTALPNSALWKKVGDVKALPLPMACTLTQFQEGNKYHFAVRAVDEVTRVGPFSDPSSIHLAIQT